MTKRSILHTLQDAIKDDLIEKCLNFENHDDITLWLFEQHGIKLSRSAVYRFSKAIRDKFQALVNLGMPIKNIVKNRFQIEALGIDQVEQTLIEKLTEKSGSLFAYLDETESSQ